MKKRLVIVIWNMGIGGIQKRMRDVALDIAHHRQSWDVIFLIRRKTDSTFASTLEGTKNIKLLYYPHQGIRFPLGFIVWVVVHLIRLKPHIVLTFLAQLAIVMAVIKRLFFGYTTRFVVNEGAYMSGYLQYNSMQYLHRFLTWAYNSMDLIIVPTHVCKNDLVERFGVEDTHIEVIPSWTMLSPSKSKLIKYDGLFIGRFELEKNPLAMIELAQYFKNKRASIRLAMVGDGKLKSKIMEQIKRNDLSSILQILSPHQAQEALSKTRILLVPSYNEGMPNVVLEAGMHQVPAIALPFPGASEVIDHRKTGYIVNNLQQMGKLLLELVNKPRKLYAIGYEAKQHTQHNFTAKNQEQFINVLLGH